MVFDWLFRRKEYAKGEISRKEEELLDIISMKILDLMKEAYFPEARVGIALADIFDIVGGDEASVKFLIKYIWGKVQETNPSNLYMNCVPKAEILIEFEDFEELLKMRNELEEAAKNTSK